VNCMGDNGFVVRYTNKDIMEKLQNIEDQIREFKEYKKSCLNQHVVGRRLAYYGFAFTFSVLCFLIGHLMGGG